MRIAVLDLTAQSSPLFDGVPRAGEEIKHWLRHGKAGFSIEIVDIAHGADMPLPDQFDGYVIGGSEFGVYDDTPWMRPLRRFLKAARAVEKPLFGICFGHQIMADTFGGKAEKSALGYQIGTREFQKDDRRFQANVWHQDQVTKVPPGARVVCRADYCPVGALTYDFPAMSVQFHPEYTSARLRQLFALGRDRFINAADADAAIASFENTSVDPALMAADTGRFFEGHTKVG